MQLAGYPPALLLLGGDHPLEQLAPRGVFAFDFLVQCCVFFRRGAEVIAGCFQFLGTLVDAALQFARPAFDGLERFLQARSHGLEG